MAPPPSRAFSDEVDTGSSKKMQPNKKHFPTKGGTGSSKKMRPNKKLERRSDSIGSECALVKRKTGLARIKKRAEQERHQRAMVMTLPFNLSNSLANKNFRLHFSTAQLANCNLKMAREFVYCAPPPASLPVSRPFLSGETRTVNTALPSAISSAAITSVFS